jgi:peptidoglycan hydrolase-like protein with peptidoglycan-binding domain
VNPYTGKKGYIQPDNNYLSSTNNYSYTPQKNQLPRSNYTHPTTTSPSINHSYSTSSFDYGEIKKEQERWMREEYPKIQAEQERWIREEYPKIKSEQARWIREEYPKIQVEQNRIFNSYNSSLSNANYFSGNSTSIAIEYHKRYSFEERKIIELALQKLGYYIGTADGYFDMNTISGIKSFQRNANLNADGKVGPSTLNRLIQQFITTANKRYSQ